MINNIGNWRQEYINAWIEVDPRFTKAFELWVQYYYHAEVFDRRVCSGFNEITKEAIPLDIYERRLINSNAINLRRNLRSRMLELGIDNEISQRAKEEATRYNHDGIVDLMIGNGWT